MPGIVGLISRMPPARAKLELSRMTEALRHEAFYTTGVWADESLGVYVGWIARQGSFSDGMPLRSEKGNVVLTFSGEEFPDPETAKQLKQLGHDVKTEGPSYIVHMYEEDSSFPACLNGRFHGLLADRARGIAMLFNDRFGMHRIYYHESKDGFYFAAEAKAILAVRPELRQADPQGLGEYVSCGCTLENRTIFKDIHVLPPGSAWVFQDSALAKKAAYFQPQEWENQATLDPESSYREIRDVFSRNLSRYFNGQERIGMSLTGGLDGRMIMAWRSPQQGPLPCYSFGGMFRECQDVVMARKVASACHLPYEVIPVGGEFLSRFPHYAERTVYLTDGAMDVIHSPDLYVNERAAKIAPVRMTGNYGGEVLRRVRAFKPVTPPDGLFGHDFLLQIQGAKKTYETLLGGHPLSFALFRQAPWHHYGLLALEQTQLALRSPYLDNEFVRTLFRAPESITMSSDVSLRLIADGNRDLLNIRTDLGLAGNQSEPVASIRRKLLEFTFKAEYAYDYGMPQSVARVDHLFSAFHLERLFLGRHKFYHFRIWYRDALSKYVQEILLDPRTLSRPYLKRQGLETIVRGHLRGDRNYTTAIHKLLTLEHIHRLFLDAQ